MSKINVRNLSNENEDGAPDIVGVTTFSATSYFVPTKGTTAQRPSDHLEEGSIRYNTDIKNLEYYRGHTIGWVQFELIDPDLGGGTGSNTGLGTRGLIFNASVPGDNETNTIEFITISTMGAQQDFGDTTVSVRQRGALSNSVRALGGGGFDGSNRSDRIDAVTIASQGNSTDFGNMIATILGSPAGISDQVRGIFGGGEVPGNTDVIQYVSISQEGNMIDFGDLTTSKNTMSGGSSSTRGIFAGGNPGSKTNTIEFITISTTGNAQDFGDLTVEKRNAAKGQSSNSIKHIVFGGQITPTVTNVIDIITIATLGNSVDFGDAPTPIENGAAVASSTRAVFLGGKENDDTTHTRIDSMEFATSGEVTSFGTLSTAASGGVGCSNGHGGL